MFFLLYQNATICDMAYYFRMMTERNTICIGQRLYRTEVSRFTNAFSVWCVLTDLCSPDSEPWELQMPSYEFELPKP